jgi:hypothetical protein
MTPARQRLLITILIALGILLVGFFGLRFMHAFRQVRTHRPNSLPPPAAQPAETDVSLIRDWMTIGYISHAYRVPPNLLYETLGIRPNGNEHKSLQEINDEYFADQPGYVLETVKNTILANQPPTAIPTPAP